MNNSMGSIIRLSNIAVAILLGFIAIYVGEESNIFSQKAIALVMAIVFVQIFANIFIKSSVVQIFFLLQSLMVCQRLIVLFLHPEQMDFIATVPLIAENYEFALILIGIFSVMFAGGAACSIIFQKGNPRFRPGLKLVTPTVLKIYLSIGCMFALVAAYEAIHHKVGLAGYLVPLAFLPIVRLSQIWTSIDIISLVPFFIGSYVRVRWLSLTYIVLSVLAAMTQTSKGALVGWVIYAVFAAVVTGSRINFRFLISMFTVCFLALFVFYPVAQNLRNILAKDVAQQSFSTTEIFQISHQSLIFKLSHRINAFDILVALSHKDREYFDEHARISQDFKQIGNILTVGDAFDVAENDNDNLLFKIPLVMRGITSESSVGHLRHSENPMFYGFFYLYWGLVGGAIMVFIFSAILQTVYDQVSIVGRLLLIKLILLDLYGGGYPLSIIRTSILALIGLFSLWCIREIVSFKKKIKIFELGET